MDTKKSEDTMNISDALEIIEKSIQCDDNEANDALDLIRYVLQPALSMLEDMKKHDALAQ